MAFFYQPDAPVDLLRAFDLVVLDPARTVLPPVSARGSGAQWFARLRADDLAALRANPAAFVRDRLDTLLAQGYAGFLLDDGVQLGAENSEVSSAMRSVLRAFSRLLPNVPLILRNHLALAATHGVQLRAVVVDGLYSTGEVHNTLLSRTPEPVRAAALRQIRSLQAHTQLPVVALDYCPLYDLACRRARASELSQQNLIPYVADPALSVVGAGALEVLPRTILMVQRDIHGSDPLDVTEGVRVYSMPLNYLGYDIQYVDVSHLPQRVTRDRYAGIVVALDDDPPHSGAWRDWLLEQIRHGVPVSVLGTFGFEIGAAEARALQVKRVPAVADPRVTPRVIHRDPMAGFEATPAPQAQGLVPIQAGANGRSLLRVEAGGQQYDPVALMPWGGYALGRNIVSSVNSLQSERWVLQPLEFFRQSLQLPRMPIPVVTTENGLRLLFVHIDGDGFASRAEFPGQAYSAQVLRDQVLKRYPIPQTVSVIQGEIAPDGLYPALSPQLERYAKEIFALPNVEMASHTYAHPFDWQAVEALIAKGPYPGWERAAKGLYLPIPGYFVNLDREIGGAVRYIDTLAPRDKKVVLVQWSGDATVSGKIVAMASQAGVLNINGGNTIITKSRNTWTAIGPIGVAKGAGDASFQVYAPDMNENVFTDDWHGPFYGYRRVRETFAMTESPHRFKPIDIYFHFYSATKLASLKALDLVYQYALSQPVMPIYTSEYVRKVLDWRHVAVGRKDGGWKIQSGESLRELRWPGGEAPVLADSLQVSGDNQGPDGTYVHLGGARAFFKLGPRSGQRAPRVIEAAGVIRDFHRSQSGLRFRFGGYYKPYIRFGEVGGCRVSVDGRVQKSADLVRVSGTARQPLQEHDIKVSCG